MDGLLKRSEITCPYCGEIIAIEVDCSAGDQRYIEDCQVCCAPLELSITVDPAGHLMGVIARRDDE